MTANNDEYPIVPPPAIVARRRFWLRITLVVAVAAAAGVAVELVNPEAFSTDAALIRALFFVFVGAFVLALTHSSGLWRLAPRDR